MSLYAKLILLLKIVQFYIYCTYGALKDESINFNLKISVH